MSGGLLQLVAYGAQDVFLTGSPQVTFFRQVYRRHTNFAMEDVEQTATGTVDFNRTATYTISRNGDLMHKVWLEVQLPALSNASDTVNWSRDIGHVIIDYVDCEIGGTRIDRHYGDWLQVWNQLSQCEEKKVGYDNLIGNVASMYTPAASVASRWVRIPLQFWFCRHAGLALPLIALQYHEVKLVFKFRTATECYVYGTADGTSSVTFSDSKLWVRYVYLDADERKRFARQNHEYLIEQVQRDESSTSAASLKIQLPFNHPVKELIWVCPPDANVASNVNEWTNYTNATGYAGNHTLSSTRNSKLQLNGHDRFSDREDNFFGLMQPYDHHKSIPQTGVYCYSFALHPEEHQPSGALNMSRIDKSDLTLNFDAGSTARKVRVYAPNYNVLRITSGMGGLAYAS